MRKSAIISKDGQHRYSLGRIWDEGLPQVLFIMLNPSTADAEKEDPTIRRCLRYAESWGYGGLWVGNLFSYRTAYPKMLSGKDNLTQLNLEHLEQMSQCTSQTICAWGNGRGWPTYITDHFAELHYLDLSKNGTPKHPLYLKGSLRPVRYEVEE